MFGKVKKILNIIDFKIKSHRVWRRLSPNSGYEPKITLDDRIKIICILHCIQGDYLKEDTEEIEDEEFREGFKVYSLNNKVIRALFSRGYTVYRTQKEIYKAQSYEIL